MPGKNAVTIGVLALQGDYEKHIQTLAACGATATAVRDPDTLNGLSGLVIPGGESTTIGKLLVRFGMFNRLKNLLDNGFPVYGSCAGLILLAREITGYEQATFGCLNVTVNRNAYGRQLESFEADLSAPALGEPSLRAVFIRAPIITAAGAEVEVLSRFEGNPVLVRQKNILASTFHPELTDDSRIHRYFLSFF
jgi:5'-phosphate synthase pdxT subunit